jgi:ATP-dependent DNA helicase RecG
MQARLERLKLRSVADLLFHLPLRYEDRTRLAAIGSLRERDQAVVAGEVQVAQVKFGRRRSLLVRIADGTGFMNLRFFHFGNPLKESLKRGTQVQCFGELRRGPQSLEMVHPELRVLKEGEAPQLESALLPIYPTTDGLTQPALRKLTMRALARAREGDELEDLVDLALLPAELRQPLLESIECLHYPQVASDASSAASASTPSDMGINNSSRSERGAGPLATPRAHDKSNRSPSFSTDIVLARQRLSFEELLANHLIHRAVRAQLSTRRAPQMAGEGPLQRRFLAGLRFSLTQAQNRVTDEVLGDLARPQPMYRLVQGDVGSGKTVVAALAAARASEARQQTAVMAPTELLAEQHMRQFSSWFEPLGVRVAWLGGRQTARARRETLSSLASGEAHIAVGTHALFQDAVRFAQLGLVIIDEQHRFGVDQRHALLRKTNTSSEMSAEPSELVDYPHQLIMTATPIPRTLQMTHFGHLDISSIDELPPGRQQVDTAVIPDSRRADVVQRIASACAEGQQAYWVCSLIEETEAVQAEAAEATAELLAEALPGLTIGLVHGRMKSTERDEVMNAFRQAGIDLLVATTVIEVGVDVPNASLMIIENAERMGLSQLHQLRGRVGRGKRKSACVLMYKGPLGRIAKARLGVLRDSTDGFVIAARDLELRGPGEVLGTRQTGDQQFRIADPGRDQEMMHSVSHAADGLLAESPKTASALIARWAGAAVRFGEVG